LGPSILEPTSVELEGTGVYGVHDWAEVHRLYQVEGMAKAAIAAKLGMSRTTVHRLLGLDRPPRYERAPAASKLDPFRDAVAAMLGEDPKVAATVIADRLRPQGFAGSLTILKQHLRQVRPAFLAAASYQRTSYLPGELAQVDWWHTGLRVPIGKGRTREAFGLVATLPASAALRVVFTLARGTAEYCAALVGCLERLGGLPRALVSDNDAGIVASRRGGLVRLVDEVAALYGVLGLRPVVLRPRFPQGKGQVERTIGYLETSFLPLRSATGLADLQAQADTWTIEVADQRQVRRLGTRVADALMVERANLRRLPERWPDVDRHLEVRASRDGFVRVAGVDYSVPPRLAGRRLGVRLSLAEVTVACEGAEVARHLRSWVPADVVLAPDHARQLRLAREATSRLATSDVQVQVADLARYDQLTEVGS
jgi:transposase